jgi:hypothetical protein
VAKVAKNQKLWNSIMRQAKAKYPTRSPLASTNRAANTWASKEYERQGGEWVSSKQEVPTNLRDIQADKVKAAKAKLAKKKRDKKRAGLL